MKQWRWFFLAIIIGVLIMVVFNLVSSLLVHKEVALVPRVEYRDRTIYSNAPCSTPSASPTSEAPLVSVPNKVYLDGIDPVQNRTTRVSPTSVQETVSSLVPDEVNSGVVFPGVTVEVELFNDSH